jgi:uncharacterized cupredoxin-like copper-binding protein
MQYQRRALIALALGSLATRALAQGHNRAGHAARAPQQTPFGIAGDPKRVARTVQLAMSDDMRFTPARLEVARGDTIRFVLKNTGKVLHEMVIGTLPALKEHAEAMRKSPGMAHDAPNMVHVKPGATGQLVWQFNRAGEFNYACLVAGHFEAGMVGTVTVK